MIGKNIQGLALSSIGEYRTAEEAHMKAIQLDQNFLEAWAHLTQVLTRNCTLWGCAIISIATESDFILQFYHELAKHKKSLECIQQILHIDKM